MLYTSRPRLGTVCKLYDMNGAGDVCNGGLWVVALLIAFFGCQWTRDQERSSFRDLARALGP